MTVKLNDRVNHDGRITTIDQLDKEGLVEFEKVDNFCSRRTKTGMTTKYFANIKGTKSGWEIGKIAYLSRIGVVNELPQEFK